ncbi:MAG: hypothetical protein ACJAS1_003830 [Oleiphilaceae bacterium]
MTKITGFINTWIETLKGFSLVMNYPEQFKQFIEFSKVLLDIVVHVENELPEYHEILASKHDKLRPYLARSYSLISEYYSVPLTDHYKDILEETHTTEPPDNAIEIFQREVDKWQSDEYLNSLFKNEEEEKLFIDESLPEMIAVLRVSMMNLQASIKFSTSINQLVQNFVDGDDASLFSAIHIDPLVESVPVIAERISFAESINDKKFLSKLNKSRIAKRTDSRQKNQSLNFFLYFFALGGVLEHLTESHMAEIFINELQLYNKDDTSLFKHITRWKKDFRIHNQRIENKVSKMSKT